MLSLKMYSTNQILPSKQGRYLGVDVNSNIKMYYFALTTDGHWRWLTLAVDQWITAYAPIEWADLPIEWIDCKKEKQ